MACFCSDGQRRVPICRGLVYVRVACKQQLDGCMMTTESGSMQRAPASLVGLVDVGAGVEQRADGLQLPMRGGALQGRSALPVRLVHARAMRDQKPDTNFLPGRSSTAQRLVLAFLRCVPAEQQFDGIGLTGRGGQHQRRVALRRPLVLVLPLCLHVPGQQDDHIVVTLLRGQHQRRQAGDGIDGAQVHATS